MAYSQSSNAWKFMVIVYIFLFCELDVVSGQVRYSIPEELEQGAIIGNIADDLGLNIASFLSRNGRLLSDYIKRYLEVNLENGMLFVNEKIDRDQLCGPTHTCILSFQIVFENSPEMYRGEVEILDINDNSPSFPERAILLQMAESMASGSRFPLESALDPDMGTNTVTAYSISPNEHFGLKVKTVDDGANIVELLLENPLDRERQSSFQLMLTATDGGSPPRSGTARILITVLDINDNAPAFDREIYKVSLVENSPRGTLVVSVHATDPDESPNAEVTYSFSNRVSQKVQELFSLDPRTGEITIQGALDFEEASSYSLNVQAFDNGSPAIAGHSKVLIKVIDVNDNAPEIKVTLVSISSKVSDDVTRGTVIALINIIDHDSGESGQVHCQIPLEVPFKLQTSSSGHYKLVTSDFLDRETTPLYNMHILVRDSGSPPLSTNKSIQISVSDINDNAPRFARPMDTAYVMENNAPGASIFTVTASDPDLDQNSYVTYSITESLIHGFQSSSYLNVNSMNGTIYALRSFDYEQIKNFQVQVQARDAGVPPLSSSATLNVIILDQNDNAPVIVSPSAPSGSAAVEIVPQSAAQGYMVTKIIATDADSGQNARLSYQVLKATDPSLFNVGLNTGEVSTARAILELDATTQTLVILVKDNGQPRLSSTVTIHFTILENVTEIFSESSNLMTNPEYVSDVNVYLIVILGSTSFIFLVIIILLIGIKCKQDRNLSEDYNSPSCCYRLEDSNDAFNLRPALKESLNYTGAGEIVRFPETHHYAVCLSPESAKSDFLFLKPYTPPMSQEKR
ncbi:protocadherin gamma-C5-like [Carcharodon carcharias]|uniref:protocadherin gamma-C5-like n=1 Tax=Carcharodon carcharias TaxID=13397 RepID=UPI001B7DB3CA|nr:protocadherin gamma-C5-like [Carcharodon carcharias]